LRKWERERNEKEGKEMEMKEVVSLSSPQMPKDLPEKLISAVIKNIIKKTSKK
jgi:hypothetical protein